MGQRKVTAQREPWFQKKLGKNEFILSKVKQKLHKVKNTLSIADQVINKSVKKEEVRMKKEQREKQKEISQNYDFIRQKLDFSKNFCEPILEEKDIDPDGAVVSKVNRAVRGVVQTTGDEIPGIIPNIDREYAASTEFLEKQQALLNNPIVFRR